MCDTATLFSAHGAAISSLDSIGDGLGLVKDGITCMSPVPHLDGTMLSVEAVAETADRTVFDVALGSLWHWAGWTASPRTGWLNS